MCDTFAQLWVLVTQTHLLLVAVALSLSVQSSHDHLSRVWALKLWVGFGIMGELPSCDHPYLLALLPCLYRFNPPMTISIVGGLWNCG